MNAAEVGRTLSDNRILNDEAVLLFTVTQFLNKENSLLDDWKLDDWLNLFSRDARYIIYPLDFGEFDEQNSLYLAVDDRERLQARVKQVLSGVAWTEKPRSRTRRFLSNIAIESAEIDHIDVICNMIIYQFRNDESYSFVGQCGYTLKKHQNSFLIEEKRIKLDHETMYSQRRISIIL